MKKFSKTFGLNSRESALLKHLFTAETETVSKISRATSIPRTTVHFLLKKLAERGLARKERVEGHYEWSLDSSATHLFTIPKTDIVDIQFGLSNFKRLYKRLSESPRGERIVAFQGNQSAQIALAELSNEFFSRMHESMKKRKIVIEGVIGESTLSLFEKLTSSSLRSHWGRATIVHVVPDHYISFDADIFSVKDKLFLFNFEKEIAITITNPAITSAFHSLLTFMLEHSEQINLNDHIQNILDSRSD